MTAIDELCRLLDEHGVRWFNKPEAIVSGVEKGIVFDAVDGRWVRAIEALDGSICVSHLTPAQAIAATLGTPILPHFWTADGTLHIDAPKTPARIVVNKNGVSEAFATESATETCKLERASWDDGTSTWGCICSACDAHLEHETGIGYNYCPICGAKVVDA